VREAASASTSLSERLLKAGIGEDPFWIVLLTRSALIRETTSTREGIDGGWPVNSAV